MVDIPTIETERLILRGHRLEDFGTTVKIWSDPVVRKHFGDRPFTREDIWGRFLRQFGMWEVMGYGAFAVEKETGDYVGTVGLFEMRREIEPNMEGVPEAGWTFAAHTHGKGYATEATAAALAWSDLKLGQPRMFAIVAPANKASIRVAEKCGFRYWRDTTYKDDPTRIYIREGT